MEGCVEALDDHGPAAGGDEWRSATRDDVEPLVQASAASGGAELSDRAAKAVRAEDRVAVAADGDGAGGPALSPGRADLDPYLPSGAAVPESVRPSHSTAWSVAGASCFSSIARTTSAPRTTRTVTSAGAGSANRKVVSIGSRWSK